MEHNNTDPILAFRTWRVVPAHLNDGLHLGSIWIQAFRWPPLKPAESLVGPDLSNEFGIHGFKTLALAMEYLDGISFTVSLASSCFGMVSLWGKVIEHEKGYRAQYAYPYHIHTWDSNLAKYLSRTYLCDADADATQYFKNRRDMGGEISWG